MTRVAVVILTLMGVLRAAAQDVIALRHQAEPAGVGPVRLHDIAELTGPGAERLGDTVIAAGVPAPDAEGWGTIDVAAVRAALRDVPGINWGKLVVRGSSCAVRREGAAPVVKPVRPAAVPGAVETDALTVRALVERRIAEVMGVEAEDLRLTFEDQDRAVLDTPVAGRSADIQLFGSSERQPVSVKLYEGLSQVVNGSVRVGVNVRRNVAVSIAGLRRGDALNAENIAVEERWLAPTLHAADPEKAMGRVARARINAGQVIEDADVESPVVIKKGDLVDVYCLSGSVSLKLVARAMEGGREGETVKFQSPDAKRTFQARIDGPNRAVTAVGAMPAAVGENPAPVAGRSASRGAAPSEAARVRANAVRGIRFAALGDRPVVKSPGAPGVKENER